MFTRRRFLGTILMGCSSSAICALTGYLPPLQVTIRKVGLPTSGRLTAEEWRVLRSFVNAIIPATPRTVSASDAGVLHYIDRALAGSYASSLATYHELVVLLANSIPRSQCQFWKLEPGEVLLRVERFEKEHPDIFAMARQHTLEGYFSAPRHGGNIDCRGWSVVRLKSHVLPWKEVQGS
ncbi:MAG: gluconate 2-dehydrogenase subunit 3 family protein [Candidatus Riflebacteria bacterium]|nr:gluconate 2-dehydrogenase subunit 3 family protein [Candidatus Riflebacteria bacterium]